MRSWRSPDPEPMTEPPLSFAGVLRQFRSEARLTQEELAEAAGLSPRAVSDLERGVNRTARKDTAPTGPVMTRAPAVSMPGPVGAVFVAAARGRTPAVDVLAVLGRSGQPGAARPRLWNIPARNRTFTGRDHLLAAVRERLLAGDTAVVQALHGM